MTAGQIRYFYSAARCTWVGYIAETARRIVNGDVDARERMINSILVNNWLKAINCYDPEGTDNCLTWAQVRVIIDRIKHILGFCDDVEGIPETETLCCNCLDDVTLLNP